VAFTPRYLDGHFAENRTDAGGVCRPKDINAEAGTEKRGRLVWTTGLKEDEKAEIWKNCRGADDSTSVRSHPHLSQLLWVALIIYL